MSYDATNVFAKIIRKEIPCKELYRDNKVLAFYDIQPAAKVHVLILPVSAYESFDDFAIRAPSGEVAYFFQKIRDIANQLGLAESGYRLIANHGKDASQTIAHFHMHLLGGEPLGGLVAKDKLVQ
jgi:histidine triad (HIT) family protein